MNKTLLGLVAAVVLAIGGAVYHDMTPRSTAAPTISIETVELPPVLLKETKGVMLVDAPASSPAPVAAAAAPATAPTKWLDVLANPAVITLLITLALGVLKHLEDNKTLEADRWTGLVTNLYNVAEDAGFVDKWSGGQKLRFAMDQFETEYIKTFGYPPGERDRTDFRNDVAKIALKDRPQLIAAPSTPAAA